MTGQPQRLRVVIAGGTHGLGESIAHAFGRTGAVVETCGRDADRAEAFEARAASLGFSLRAQPLDVTDSPALRSWLESAVDRLDGLDVFVANAGTAAAGDNWRQSLDHTLLYVVEACDVLENSLATSQGAVVIIGSVAGLDLPVGPDVIAYGSAKAALAHFAVQLAHQWGPLGIRVNVLAPGPVIVPEGHWATEVQLDTPTARSITRRAALRRMVTANEVAEACVFLAGSTASGITGVVLRVDAGFAGGEP